MNRLAAIPLFKGAEIDLAPYETRVRCRYFQPGEVLVDFDDESTDVYFVISGDVRVLIRTRSGKEVILGEIRAGALFGELAALDGIRRSANVTALTARRGVRDVVGGVPRHRVLGQDGRRPRLPPSHRPRA